MPLGGGPAEGTALATVGINHAEHVSVYGHPAGEEVVATLDSLAQEIVATGNIRVLEANLWYEVSVGEATGWVNSLHLAYLGSADDVTWQIITSMGQTPTTETMIDLGQIVAEAVAADDPLSRIAISGAPVVGDLGEITMDVTNPSGDVFVGFRLHVFAHVHENGEGFTLKSIERTWLCARIVAGEPASEADGCRAL